MRTLTILIVLGFALPSNVPGQTPPWERDWREVPVEEGVRDWSADTYAAITGATARLYWDTESMSVEGWRVFHVLLEMNQGGSVFSWYTASALHCGELSRLELQVAFIEDGEPEHVDGVRESGWVAEVEQALGDREGSLRDAFESWVVDGSAACAWAASGDGGSGAEREDTRFSCRSFPADLTHDQLVARYGPDRVSIGSIEPMNGWPFRLCGLARESLGVVRSWGPQGRLTDEGGSGCRIAIHFQVRQGEERNDLVRQVSRGQEFSSGHPAFQNLNPTVQFLRPCFPPLTWAPGQTRSTGPEPPGSVPGQPGSRQSVLRGSILEFERSGGARSAWLCRLPARGRLAASPLKPVASSCPAGAWVPPNTTSARLV